MFVESVLIVFLFRSRFGHTVDVLAMQHDMAVAIFDTFSLGSSNKFASTSKTLRGFEFSSVDR